MPYVTKQDLIDRFGEQELIQLTDRVNKPASTVNDTAVDLAIADASNLADSYLAKVVTLPLDPVPGALPKVVADLARYFLHGKAADKESPVTTAYEQAIAFLRDVAKGLVQLTDSGSETPPAGGGSVKAVAPNRVFTRDSLRSF